MSTKKVLLFVGVAGVIGVVAAAGMKGGDEGVEVRAERVERRDLVSIVTASGKIEPKKKVDISADIPGRVIRLAVEEGQWVNRGDLLLVIDPTQYQAAANRAQAAVSQSQAQAAQARAQVLKAENDLKRAEMLSQGENLISAADLEQARTQARVAEAQAEAARHAVAQAQAALSEARDNLAKTTIVAPMSGRVTRRNIEEGETAIIGTMNNPGSLLLTVADLSVMEATVKVDETDVPSITIGDSAVVRIDAFPGQTFAGKVTRIGNSAVQTAASQAGAGDQQSVDYEVKITLDDPPEALRPDLSATADIVTETRERVLAVPIISLAVRDPDGKKFQADEDAAEAGEGVAEAEQRARKASEVTGVFVIAGDSVTWVPVTTGIAGDRYFEITGGLKGGETVVAGTYQAIRELEAGAAVRVQGAGGEETKGKDAGKAKEGK